MGKATIKMSVETKSNLMKMLEKTNAIKTMIMMQEITVAKRLKRISLFLVLGIRLAKE